MAVSNSGQWEVVGSKASKQKSKASSDAEGKPDKSGGEKKSLPVLKLDELVTPMDARFAVLDPQSKKEKSDKKKPKTSPPSDKPKKKPAKEPVKEKERAPKNLDDAIKRINVAEFNELMETMKLRFSESPLFWLKEMTSYLNLRFNVHSDPVYSGKPSDYPSSSLPSDVRKTITTTIKSCSDGTLQTYYEQSLLTMPEDMNKNLNVDGTKLILQLITFQKPDLALKNKERFNNLLSENRSRIPVCLSLLWVLSQSALRNQRIGFELWLDVMLPLMTLKNFASFIGHISSQLSSKVHESKWPKEVMTVDQYFRCFDTIYGPGLSANNRKEVSPLFQAFTRYMISDSPSAMFSQLFERLSDTAHTTDVLKSLVGCLKSNPIAFETWLKEYKSNMKSSGLLLKWISEHESKMVRNSPHFKSALHHIRSINESLSESGRNPDGLKDCVYYSDRLLKKSQTKKSSGKSLRWMNYLLILGIIAVVYYDVHYHGNGDWNQSRLGLFMEKYGVSERVRYAYQQSEPHLKLVREKTQPLIDQLIVLSNQVRGTVYQKGEEYFPGIWEEADKKCRALSVLVREYAVIATDFSLKYGGQAWQIIRENSIELYSWAVIRLKPVSDWISQWITQENAHFIVEYTYQMYHRALHAIGLCTH